MQLILDDYGVSLEKNENMFFIQQGAQRRSVSPVKVTAIHIYKTVTVSTAALLLAGEHEIPVLIYDNRYKPAIRLWNSNFTSTGIVRVMQPLFCKSAGGLCWCKKLVALKMRGQLQHAGYIRNRWPLLTPDCGIAIRQISSSLQQVENMKDSAGAIASLRGLEGIATVACWKLLQSLLDKEVFRKREQQQPADKFNPCINYLYGILYGKVEGALLAYGLDPMVGIMHAEGYSKKSLVYDCMEPFRPWAEMTAVQLFKSRALQSIHFEYETAEIKLTRDARRILIMEFSKMLNEKTLLNNRRITRNDQIFFLCSQLAQAVKNYKPDKPGIR